jgi:hypothetical protein
MVVILNTWYKLFVFILHVSYCILHRLSYKTGFKIFTNNTEFLQTVLSNLTYVILLSLGYRKICRGRKR